MLFIALQPIPPDSILFYSILFLSTISKCSLRTFAPLALFYRILDFPCRYTSIANSLSQSRAGGGGGTELGGIVKRGSLIIQACGYFSIYIY